MAPWITSRSSAVNCSEPSKRPNHGVRHLQTLECTLHAQTFHRILREFLPQAGCVREDDGDSIEIDVLSSSVSRVVAGPGVTMAARSFL